MALHTIEISLRLELTSALHIGTGYGLAGYLDALTLTDADGYPYVPGSSLKGRLRYYARELLRPWGQAGSPAVANIFGAEDQAGNLIFGDLNLTPDWRNLIQQAGGQHAASGLRAEHRTHVMLSRLRGVALEQRLFSVETAPAHLTFAGRISGVLPDAGRVATVSGRPCPRDLALLVAAVQALTHLGGRKTRGLGRGQLQIAAAGLTVAGQTIDPDRLLEAL